MRVPAAAVLAAVLAVALAVALALAGCAGGPRPAPAPAVAAPVPARALGARAAGLALRLLGTPYQNGGTSREGVDCSGLVVYVYRELGVRVPRTAAEQRSWAERLPRESLEPGDLVFFTTPEDHVGIYVGDGEFVHAPGAGRGVERTRLDTPYFILGFAGGGRVHVEAAPR
ncbi:MAG: C40 family peptidase [Proteobacteria bacterium]|nr:C40 family peptidase [Pseudomonadota bacterium]